MLFQLIKFIEMSECGKGGRAGRRIWSELISECMKETEGGSRSAERGRLQRVLRASGPFCLLLVYATWVVIRGEEGAGW